MKTAMLPLALLAAGSMLGPQAPALQTFDSNGVPIAYTVEGQGEPVVLIHGLNSSAGMNWRAPGTIGRLARSYQVIALDLRGHGRSGKPLESGAYGTEMVEDVIRLLDHLEIKTAHIIGYSMGGMITLKLITEHPERVRSAMLGGMGWLRSGSAMQNFWGKLPNKEATRTPSACVRSLGQLAVTKDEVKNVRVPVEIVIGDRDPVRRLYVAPLQPVRPDWPIILISGAGHLNCAIKPQFQDELQKWLDQHKQ
ncbi:MAG TPA: alpha/beta hydrolase [Acidobacteriota bacterium]